MQAQRVNGYLNQETYDLALWCLNDAGLYAVLSNQNADYIKEFFEEQIDLLLTGPEDLTETMRRLIIDVGSFWRVEWSEIENSLIDE